MKKNLFEAKMMTKRNEDNQAKYLKP